MKYDMNEMLKKYSHSITLEQTKQMYIESEKTCINASSFKSLSGEYIVWYLMVR